MRCGPHPSFGVTPPVAIGVTCLFIIYNYDVVLYLILCIAELLLYLNITLFVVRTDILLLFCIFTITVNITLTELLYVFQIIFIQCYIYLMHHVSHCQCICLIAQTTAV